MRMLRSRNWRLGRLAEGAERQSSIPAAIIEAVPADRGIGLPGQHSTVQFAAMSMGAHGQILGQTIELILIRVNDATRPHRQAIHQRRGPDQHMETPFWVHGIGPRQANLIFPPTLKPVGQLVLPLRVAP